MKRKNLSQNPRYSTGDSMLADLVKSLGTRTIEVLDGLPVLTLCDPVGGATCSVSRYDANNYQIPYICLINLISFYNSR